MGCDTILTKNMWKWLFQLRFNGYAFDGTSWFDGDNDISNEGTASGKKMSTAKTCVKIDTLTSMVASSQRELCLFLWCK